ncbi:Mitochondrial Rho GTPase 1-like protein, partial [Leptotrombidium deliense]
LAGITMGPKNGKKDVRILLVGDPGVGKTSLIYTLVSEEFSEEVPSKAEEITIPPDVTPEKVTTQIVDFSAQEQEHNSLIQEIHKANVICVVYAVDDDDTIDKITTFWLPLIREQLGEEHNKPIVLVGNKIDLVEYSSLELILPIMNQFPEVETCVECSAKSLKNISELFYYAQKAVLHPTSPLYSSEDRDLTDKCKRALSRIFRLCDIDNDGILNDAELNRFQKRCFNSPLQPQALDDVKNIVKRSIPDGVFDEGLTLSGFLFLHTLFIQRGRHETTWTVLRKFGYNDHVELGEEYLSPKLEVPYGCSTELTLLGYRFLTNLFERFDSNKDGALSYTDLQSMFNVCPSIPVWFQKEVISNTVNVNQKGYITLNGFLALWTLMTAVDVKRAMEYLAYLGYVVPPEENQLTAIFVTRDKRIDLQQRQTNRKVFICHVIGPKGAGKSSFIKGLLERTLDDQRAHNFHENTLTPNYAVNTTQIYGQDKYLIMREVDILSLSDKLTEPELMCDVVCLMYDTTDPHSFEYIARIYLKHFMDCKLPVLMVSAKCDEPCVPQQYVYQPDNFCSKYKLPKPISFTINENKVTQEVYVKLTTMAAYPNLRRLVHALMMRPSSSWVTNHLSSLQNVLMNDSRTLLKTGIGLATIAIVGIFIVKLMRLQSTNR